MDTYICKGKKNSWRCFNEACERCRNIIGEFACLKTDYNKCEHYCDHEGYRNYRREYMKNYKNAHAPDRLFLKLSGEDRYEETLEALISAHRVCSDDNEVYVKVCGPLHGIMHFHAGRLYLTYLLNEDRFDYNVKCTDSVDPFAVLLLRHMLPWDLVRYLNDFLHY
jgi:hypothetical protein